MPEIVFKGKEYVYNHHLTVPYRPLQPLADKGVGAPDLSGNLVIHGDNLHALKSLLPRCAGAVDLIFIDPPYNTGNEGWCYSDGVNSPIMKEWLTTNPVDGEDMLRHDKWLCMMWPRLVLLSELLADHGVLAICIDENEVHRLFCAVTEILGEESYVGSVVWRTRNVDNRIATKLSTDHEYVLLFSKGKRVRGRTIDRSDFSNPDADPKGAYVTDPLTGKAKADRRPNLHYPIEHPTDGRVFHPDPDLGWITDKDGFEKLLSEKRIAWPISASGKPRKKRYLSETAARMPETTFWSDFKGVSGYDELDRIFGERPFDFPKPLSFAERVIDLCASSDALILDSFAGSGTTAHAVLKANAKDGGNRRFILVEGEAYADTLTAERVRRAIKGYAWEGTQRETLLEEKITFTQFKKAAEWLAKVDAIKRAEGLVDEGDGQGDLVEQAAPKATHRKRFDKIETKIDDGVLRVEGVRRISEMAPGLGGSFTYCTLGDAVDLDKLLSGERLPAFDALGAWLFYTATGGVLPPAPKKAPPWYLGEAKDCHVWLVYQPDLNFLKSPEAALTLSLAKQFQCWGKEHDSTRERKPLRHLVFAPAKYLSNRQLQEHGVDYAPLPFALYREA
ncbi:site-specific DNA-methyltransferase [Hydrogenophaga defluvii]|uniref:site-specific DNA-methyltransferase (adenine-specific) n=1 Tax=Hydrogenophaga defluvii TaxID=249410 RepID=A0ABW2S8Q0_9BURK